MPRLFHDHPYQYVESYLWQHHDPNSVVTTFGFELIARFSSLMLVAFLLVMSWVLGSILLQADTSTTESVMFGSQFPAAALQGMGVLSDWDKFVFSMNILIGPACALPLVAVDYGRYAKSTGHATTAVVIGSFFQSVIVMLIGGILMYGVAQGLTEYFMNANHALSIEGNSIDGGSVGIHFMGNSESSILNNVIRNNCRGIFLDSNMGCPGLLPSFEGAH
jgi:hypothetical protein